MRFFLLLTFGFLCILTQSNLFLCHYVFPVKPDLTIPLVAYISLFFSAAQGVALVSLIGYLMDITSGGVVGFYIFLRTMIFLVIYLLKGHLSLENKVFFLGAVMGFFLLEQFWADLLFRFMDITKGPAQQAVATAFYHGAFTVALWIVLSPLLTKLERLVEKFRGF